jgi:uncharacterized protein (TIGR03067 family)
VSRLLAALLLVPITTLAAPALKARPAKEPPSVVGEWVRVGHVQAGTDAWRDSEPHHQVFRADGTWEYTYGDGPSPTGMGYAADPKQTPPTIDIRWKAGQPPKWRGIYKVEGDTLTLCLVTAGRDRPTKFESSADQPTTLWVFKRVKGND